MHVLGLQFIDLLFKLILRKWQCEFIILSVDFSYLLSNITSVNLLIFDLSCEAKKVFVPLQVLFESKYILRVYDRVSVDLLESVFKDYITPAWRPLNNKQKSPWLDLPNF